MKIRKKFYSFILLLLNHQIYAQPPNPFGPEDSQATQDYQKINKHYEIVKGMLESFQAVNIPTEISQKTIREFSSNTYYFILTGDNELLGYMILGTINIYLKLKEDLISRGLENSILGIGNDTLFAEAWEIYRRKITSTKEEINNKRDIF